MVSPSLNTPKIPSHGLFGNAEAELQKLAVDLGSTPHRILFRHAANQGLNLGGDLRSTARACTRAPSPVEPEPGSMPAHHGVRLNNDEGRCPTRPDAAQDGPEQPVKGAQVRARMFSFEYRELLTQGQDLQGAIAPTAEEDSQCRQDCRNKIKHEP
jgi:hypothetical protein